MKKFIGAIDQGTTSTKFILFDHESNIVASHQKEHKQIFPKAGWVEHDPIEIWRNTKQVIKTALQKAKIYWQSNCCNWNYKSARNYSCLG